VFWLTAANPSKAPPAIISMRGRLQKSHLSCRDRSALDGYKLWMTHCLLLAARSEKLTILLLRR
jgi:hypothetical protein